MHLADLLPRTDSSLPTDARSASDSPPLPHAQPDLAGNGTSALAKVQYTRLAT